MNINKYPYTDFHELNLDWFLAQFKNLTDAWGGQQADYNKFKEDVTAEFNNLSGKFNTLEETVQSFTRFITNYFDNLDVQQEINNKLDELVSDGTMTELIKPIFDAYAAQMTQRMNVLESRMDEFASLPDGSTAGDAELRDIRIGGNGVTYASAGAAVRAQYNINHTDINKLKESVDNALFTEEPSELPYTDTENQYINGNGAIIQVTSELHTASLEVTEGTKYTITGSVRYGNRYYAFYDSNMVLLLMGPQNQSGSTVTNFTETATAPSNAKYLYVSFIPAYQVAVISESVKIVTLKKWSGLKWACIGDSLTATNAMTTKHYYDYVADYTGIIPVNLGKNGTGYAKASGSGEAYYNRMSDVPTDSDVVTIFGSFNDLTSGLEFGTEDDTGITTIGGCINTTISNLQARIPLVNLGIVAPTPWDTTRPNFVETSNAYKYYNLLKRICERRSIPFLDLWYHSGLRPWDADFREVAYSKDGGSGTHPDENGHKIIAPHFESFLESLLLH